jgi:hypothetical protein
MSNIPTHECVSAQHQAEEFGTHFALRLGDKKNPFRAYNEGHAMIHLSKSGRWFLLLGIILLLGIPAYAEDAKHMKTTAASAISVPNAGTAYAPPL